MKKLFLAIWLILLLCSTTYAQQCDDHPDVAWLSPAMIGTVPAAAGGGCSGSYGNQLTTDAGSIADATLECLVKKITGACDGNTASVTIRWHDLDPASSPARASVVIYSDNAGEPSTLLGSAVVTGASIVNYTWRTTNLVVDTNSTTFWIGWCGESSVSAAYSATTGGIARTMYNCTTWTYDAPPATWGTNCTNDPDYNAYNHEFYMTY